MDGVPKDGAIEAEILGQEPDVVEILHPAICQTSLDHRVELLCDDGFAWVHPQDWRGHGKQRGISGNMSRVAADADGR